MSNEPAPVAPRSRSDREGPEEALDESPTHEVTVSGFWMLDHEVTNRELRVGTSQTSQRWGACVPWGSFGSSAVWARSANRRRDDTGIGFWDLDFRPVVPSLQN